ncbi:hypothetical protein B0T16DRAFT_400942 [Cercophora newfieldiana]|uniref:Uncharacterized protein n=1 Tax=Cercophora newfieldiana TaxID=92897 RepID=A0AA39YR68_9PEZI|nr:hypothetical protein B0T16DRAFT_400942 [Cercophora newfieldiana]
MAATAVSLVEQQPSSDEVQSSNHNNTNGHTKSQPKNCGPCQTSQASRPRQRIEKNRRRIKPQKKPSVSMTNNPKSCNAVELDCKKPEKKYFTSRLLVGHPGSLG